MTGGRSGRPARQVCPLCSRDDLIEVATIGPGLWRYTCAGRRHRPAGAFSWQSTATSRVDEEDLGGKAAELGLYEDLPRCLELGEPFVEYGVVEHRYALLRPDVFKRLLADYSHTRIERGKEYTASVFIASALTRLAERGDVLYAVGAATGYWAYNEGISYWALPPGPTDAGARLSYVEFARREGLDPLA